MKLGCICLAAILISVVGCVNQHYANKSDRLETVERIQPAQNSTSTMTREDTQVDGQIGKQPPRTNEVLPIPPTERESAPVRLVPMKPEPGQDHFLI
jgi:hypothetical protein